MKFYKVLLIVSLALGVRGQVWADQMQLANGDCLSGEVKSIENGKIKFESPVLGVLVVEVAKVANIRTEAAGPILLKKDLEFAEGRIVPGAIQTAGEARAVELPEIVAFREGVAALAYENRILWTHRLEAGVIGHSGNNDQVKVNAMLSGEGMNENWLIKYLANGIYGRQKDREDNTTFETDNKVRSGGHLERLLLEHLSVYGAGEAERDVIQELEFRGRYVGGLGYPFVRRKDFLYELRTGLGQEVEKFETGEKNSSVIGDLGSELKYLVNKRLELNQQTNWIPRLDQPEYRITADSAAVVYLNEQKNLFLRSGLRNEFNSAAVPGTAKLDTYYFTNLGYKF